VTSCRFGQDDGATDEAFSTHQDEKEAQWSQLIVEAELGESGNGLDSADLLSFAFTQASADLPLRTRAIATAMTAPFSATRSTIVRSAACHSLLAPARYDVSARCVCRSKRTVSLAVNKVCHEYPTAPSAPRPMYHGHGPCGRHLGTSITVHYHSYSIVPRCMVTAIGGGVHRGQGDNALGAGASVGFVRRSVWFTQGKLLDGIASSRAEKDVPTILEIMQRHPGLVEIQE
jgi:hypothetical protein